LYSLGYLAFKAGRFDEAVQHYSRLVERYGQDPLAAKAQYGIGDAYYNAGRMEEAAAAYQRVLERYPSSPFAAEAAASLDNVLTETGQAGRAREVLDRFTQSAPPEIGEALRYRQAETAFARGDYQSARLALTPLARSARSEEVRLDAAFLLADIAVAEGRTEEAAEGYRRVSNAEGYAHRAEAARRLGDVLLGANDARTALEAYRRAESLADGDERITTAARIGQARALLVLNQAADAEALVAPLAATDATAALVLGRIQEATGRTDAAVASYRRAATDETVVGAEATGRLGALLLTRGDAAGALAAVQGAETRFEGFDAELAQALLVRARALRALNRTADARTAYLDVETRFPGTEAARTAAQERGQ
ncbi:MAG TPA: tetratricopeptide repeat protein, partial [Rhodothermales bacterium]|nr:tetratricopeptide repeat protein [Rhodothermales bacterium]